MKAEELLVFVGGTAGQRRQRADVTAATDGTGAKEVVERSRTLWRLLAYGLKPGLEQACQRRLPSAKETQSQRNEREEQGTHLLAINIHLLGQQGGDDF